MGLTPALQGVVTISNNGEQVRIYMLGGFKIAFGKAQISDQEKRTSKILKLLQYLIVHMHRLIPQSELIDVFCDGEAMRNPGNSLRTMIYRARSLLATAGFELADDMIISKSGGYTWNSNIPYIVDVDEFEQLYETTITSSITKEHLDVLLRAVEIYKGDFLPDSAGESWVMPLGRRYRSMYIICVHKALKLLIEDNRSEEAERLCADALRVDPFDEKILEYRLRALLAQDKNQDALDEYKRMETMFFEVMGVSFSESLRKLYNQIQRPAVKEGIALSDMLDEWRQGADFPGAFYCDLSVFKTVYQIEARSASRSGKSIYIVRIDTKHEPGERRMSVMRHLGMMIPGSLRKGDLFTRSSPSQYMLMLHSLTYEDCKSLVNRILRSLDAQKLAKILGTSIIPLVPID